MACAVCSPANVTCNTVYPTLSPCQCNDTPAIREEGPAGGAATITVGNVQTVPDGDPAVVINVGTSTAAIFDFQIPAGPEGPAPDFNDPQVFGSTILVTGQAGFNDDVVLNRHIISGTTVPTASDGGSGAGTGAQTFSIAGTDIAGVVTVNTGAAPVGAQGVVAVTFGSNYISTPRAIVLTPNNQAAADYDKNLFPSVRTLAGFTLQASTTALAALTTYEWNYIVIA